MNIDRDTALPDGHRGMSNALHAGGGAPLAALLSQLSQSTLTDDCFEQVLDNCAPPTLLVLKGVCKAWRRRIRRMLCNAEWSQRHGLPAAWAAAARASAELERTKRRQQRLVVFKMLSQANLALNYRQDLHHYWHFGLLAAVLLVYSAVLNTLSLTGNMIGDVGAVAIGEALKGNAVLQKL